MGHIIPKLNLNKTPQAVDSNGLVFAKNIKVNTDGSLGRDNSISQVEADGRVIDLSKITGNIANRTSRYLGHIVGVNSCIYFFMELVDTNDNDEVTATHYKVYEYNEVAETLRLVQCNWTYHGGKITGCVTTNNTNQKILTVSEYDCEELVPLKHINLSECKANDDESIYTQNPNIPITNLHFAGYYSCTIPNGVYQFFVRYKVRDGFYTNWFPASKELYAGDQEDINTIQGSLRYVDLDKDCSKSFIFDVEHLIPINKRYFEEFQIGFILSNGNASVGRSWKSFRLDITEIKFDYEKNYIEEVLVDDFLKVNYELYNSKNVINYKNKLYIANYVESNLNENLQQYADKISVGIVQEDVKFNSDGKFYLNKKELKSSDNNDNYDIIILDGVETDIKQIFSDDNYCNISLNNNRTFNHIYYFNNYYEADWSSIKNNVRWDTYNPYKLVINYDGGSEEILNLGDFHDLYASGQLLLQLKDSTYKTNYSYYELYDMLYDIATDIAVTHIKDYISFIKHSDGCFYVNIDGYDKRLLSIELSIVSPTYNEYIRNSYTIVDIDFDAYSINLLCTPKDIDSEYTSTSYQWNSLMPYTMYAFYVHYVKSNGIVTNGYFVDTAIYNIDSRTPASAFILKPVFQFNDVNNVIPNGYAACFISCVPIKNQVAQLINSDETDANYKTTECIELDALLFNGNKDLTLIRKSSNSSDNYEPIVVTNFGKYYGSNINNPLKAFGVCGYINYSGSGTPLYLINVTSQQELKDLNLVKATPYLNELNLNAVISNGTIAAYEYSDVEDMTLPAFLCKVTKLIKKDTEDLYVSGYDVFEKTINTDNSANNITLEEANNVLNFKQSNFHHILSTYNLNFLTLRESLNKGFRTWNKQTETTTTDDGSTTTEILDKQWIVSVNSQNCSLIYDLPLMYREYTRKYYSVVDDKTFTVFDNTVRSSNIDVDEVFRSVYKFDAEDYYNVPTNRGIIVNLFSINNEIFVHTEHGLFKFTDSSLLKVGDNLYSSNKEVGVSESSPFEIGIAEIVDSQYGHGGLQNKEHALITFNGYIFYDSLVRNIYSYDNQSGIQNITSPVRKVIDWFEPTDVTFVSDDANNRFFITLSKVVDDIKKVICLSYSFISKSFVSIHDINYDYAFNSRLNTYFIQGNNFLKVNHNDFGSYVNNYHSVLTINDEVAFNEDSVGSCIDIIVNDGFEVIKFLSHIHWICSNINDYVGENPYNVAEEVIDEYGGDDIRVYSDQTWSDLLPINTKQNTQQINSANSYQYPRYNNGIWTMNYFRDIKNADSNYISDDMALIHGKYIVVRFIFGANKKNFKFENLNINFKNYEKV